MKHHHREGVTGASMHEQRKADHLRISLNEDVRFPRLTTGLERYRFVHQALPDLDLPAIDLSTHLLAKRLRLPLLISSMTGGTAEAEVINRRLAEAAQATGVGLGLGSLRAALESSQLQRTFDVRPLAPDILLLANLGAVQLNYGYTVDDYRRAVQMVGADALILHLNPLQEALQAEGNVNWRGLLVKIEAVCRELEVPVVVKEVGWGISEAVARELRDAGVSAIDVAGAGGTSWSEVERHREVNLSRRHLADSFGDWGIPMIDSLQAALRAAPELPVIASGGIRSGVDVAKVLALGASAAGIATPFLKAAAEGTKAILELLDQIATELRVAMFCSGSGHVAALRDPGRLVAAA
jgi:isopentenyl-diphosphate delta-isomerase